MPVDEVLAYRDACINAAIEADRRARGEPYAQLIVVDEDDTWPQLVYLKGVNLAPGLHNLYLAPQPAEPGGKTDWNAELASWSDEDFIRIFHEHPDLANRLRKILAEPVKRKRLYAPGSALGEFGVIPMCDQYLEDEPVMVPPGYALIAEKYLEEMIGPELMDQLAKREL